MNRREFISLFGGVALAWSLAAHAQESPTIGANKATTATLPQIEMARVKPVDRMPPNLRLSDNLIDLMISVVPGRHHCPRRRRSTSATGGGEITLSRPP